MNHPSSSPNPPVETGVGAHAETLNMVNLDTPTEVRQFEKGRFEVYHVGPAVLGRATYEPGWCWSEHVGPTVGSASCQVEHVGFVLSGQAIARMDDGIERLMKAGDLFYVPAGHDSWVIGDEPYVSLHILGSEDYAAPAGEHPTTPGHIERLESLYNAFNARDIERVLEQLGVGRLAKRVGRRPPPRPQRCSRLLEAAVGVDRPARRANRIQQHERRRYQGHRQPDGARSTRRGSADGSDRQSWETLSVGSPQTLSEAERRIVAAWAADCAERVLGLFEAEAPHGTRPRESIARTRAFARRELDVVEEIRRRFVGGGVTREVINPAAAAAARAVGQAAAVPHMGAHALGAAAYAAKASGLAAPDRPEAVGEEIQWQLSNLPAPARAALRQLPPVGEDRSGPLGPGLLSSGLLGAIIRELQAGLVDVEC